MIRPSAGSPIPGWLPWGQTGGCGSCVVERYWYLTTACDLLHTCYTHTSHCPLGWLWVLGSGEKLVIDYACDTLHTTLIWCLTTAFDLLHTWHTSQDVQLWVVCRGNILVFYYCMWHYTLPQAGFWLLPVTFYTSKTPDTLHNWHLHTWLFLTQHIQLITYSKYLLWTLFPSKYGILYVLYFYFIFYPQH